jgi:NDP-sugar pyrophosphorylase family protein
MNSEYVETRHPEYQVVIIVDFDDGRLFPLTEQTPKCLLPIANKKLLAYQLDMLTKSGVAGKFSFNCILHALVIKNFLSILETYIVSPEDYEAELNHFLHDYVRGSMSIELVVAQNMMGSADALRAVSDRIRGDFFCLGADFISQVSLADMVNLHRLSVSDVTMLFSVPSKDSIKDDLDQEYVALSDEGRVLLKVPTLEIDEMINLSKYLLNKTSSFNLRNDLFDMGIYLMSHWIIEFVCSNHKFSSVRSDLIPFLVQRQFQPKEYLYEAMPPIEHRKRPLASIESWIVAGNLRQSSNIGYQTILDARDEDNNDILRCFALVYEPFLASNNASTDVKAAANATAPTPFLLTRLTNIPTYLNMNK